MWLFVLLLMSMCATLGFMLSASDRDRGRLHRQIRELTDLIAYKRNERFNSLVLTVNGTSYTFECHSYDRALEILASHHALWSTENGPKPTVDKFELL
jgi:hypothetical protein